ADTVEDTARVAALEDAVAAFDAAAVAADAAYEAMEADFSKAEERRRSYVPRRSWMGPTVPFPIHMRPTAFPGTFGGWGGGFGRPTRRSSWGGGGGGRSRSRPSGGSGRGGSSRRGGGRGW
ncbi:MAG: hypothetical protein ACE5EL_03410, partial [Anaerolineae bacterium]